MTPQKDRITAALREIGAAWATSANKHCSPNDPLEDQIAGRATYHIHPDQSEPRSEYIQRFDSLKELEAWIRERKAERRAPRGGSRMTISLPICWKEELRQRYGSVQAAIEILVKKEIENV